MDGVPIVGGAIPVVDQGTDSATATYPTATLTVGAHNITATYMDISGTHLNSPPSPVLIQTVIEGTGVTLVTLVTG